MIGRHVLIMITEGMYLHAVIDIFHLIFNIDYFVWLCWNCKNKKL